MILKHKDFGGYGKPELILIHGMLGSSRNWVSIARCLTAHFHVIGLDMRNHGSSPHADAMDYPLMAEDVLRWMDTHAVPSARFIGHSMGGKIVMRLLHYHPDRVTQAVIGDVAPKNYPPFFADAFRAMQAVKPGACSRLSEADALMAPIEPDDKLRQFLLTNLRRREDGRLDWIIHLESFTANMDKLSEPPFGPDDRCLEPILFLRGEFSRFVTDDDLRTILRHFPNATIGCIPNAGHNVHFDNREAFCKETLQFFGIPAGLPQS